MASRSRTVRLDEATGRTEAEPPTDRPAPARAARARPSDRTRVKRVAAGLLVAGLAVAWLVVGRQRSPEGRPAEAAAPGRAAVAPPVADTGALRALLADAKRCADVVGPEPKVQCEIGDVHMDAQLLGIARAHDVYLVASGARVAARRGPPACARGRPDERAWSRPDAPEVAVGRYRCRIEDGRAAIWWTDEHGVVAHAVGVDRDLSSLFRWWCVRRNG
jgi:hypothetical protein